MSVRNARTMYQEYLKSEKVNKEKDAKAAMNKQNIEELSIMKDKCRCLETDYAAMEVDADKLSEQAESTSKLTLFANSNAIHLGAKTKDDAMKKLD